MERVRANEKLRADIIDFLTVHHGTQYHLVALLDHVRKLGFVGAPDTPRRVADELKRDKLVKFRLVSRPKSLYYAGENE
jgi:hypothetical protein